jgi:predicted RNA-binding protein with RPS1 domain
MDFASYAERARGFDLRPLTQDPLRKLSRLFDRGLSLTEVHARYARELGGHDVAAYRHAREIWREHQRWQRSVRELVARRSEAGKLLLPDDAIRTTWTRSGLELIEAIDDRFDASAFDSHAAWTGTLTVAARHWQTVLETALAEGRYEGGDVPLDLADLSASIWTTHRAAETESSEAGGLALPPCAPIEGIEAHLERLVTHDAAEVRAWIDSEISERLPGGVTDVLDRRSVVDAVRQGTSRYEGLLGAKPLQGDCARAVFFQGPEDPVGLAVVQRDGVVRDATTTDFDVDDAGILAWMTSNAADDDPIVVPSGIEARERVDALEKTVGDDAKVVPVLAYGLPEDDDEGGFDLSELPQAKAAIALAMRAFKPKRLWRSLNAAEVVVTELQVHLSEEDRARLVDAIDEIRGEGDEGRADGSSDRKGSGRGDPGAPRSEAPQGASNPRVKSLGDLEPGMELKGRVANLNRFGAFVDIGIAKEGLIPMHALTSGFTTSPSEVVKNGQEVHVTVQTVDRARGRFDLSIDKVLPMTPADEQAAARRSKRGGRTGGRGGRGGRRGRGGGGGGPRHDGG